MTSACVIGVDPGPVTGIALLGRLGRIEVAQCTPGAVLAVIAALIGEVPDAQVVIVAVERFVVGPRAARSSTPAAGRVTRGVIEEIAREFKACNAPAGTRLVERSAAEVKPWATDRRLDAAGLLALTKGMTHARDAARHALFAAISDCGVPDPLSTRNRSPR